MLHDDFYIFKADLKSISCHQHCVSVTLLDISGVLNAPFVKSVMLLSVFISMFVKVKKTKE